MDNEIKTDTNAGVDADAMERLRDRTDELELIISSLTIFALFSIPGWLFETVAGFYMHLSTSLAIATSLTMTLLAGVCYGLAACFVVHLMARSYWVGLIGLRTIFPDGINWSKTPGLGPLGRQYYRDLLPDLDTVIQKTDRVASSLFAVISMLTLGIGWFGIIMVTTLVVAGSVGSQFGLTNTGLGIGTLVLMVLFIGAPTLVYILDAQLASRVSGLQSNRAFRVVVGALQRIAGLAYPQRLVLPVQLTLQSNTRPFVFFFALLLGVVAIVAIGSTRAAAWRSFTLSNEFRYLDDADAAEGFRTTYYEDMPSDLDRLSGAPRIDSFHQSNSFVRLFLPYQPLRDNLVLDRLCNEPEATEERVNCLRRLWTVSIEGREVPMQGFVSAERGDIGMRGLIGLVPLSGLEPGMHTIEVVWSSYVTDIEALDDRYPEASFDYTIPLVFSPAFEMPLDQ